MRDRICHAVLTALIGIAILPSAAYAREVRFRLTPSSGTAQVIEVHRSLKCAHGGDRSDDALACPGWRQVQHGGILNLAAGEYCVYARWENGRTYSGSLIVEPGATRMLVRLRPSNVVLQGPCQ